MSQKPHEFTGRVVNGEPICKFCSATKSEAVYALGLTCEQPDQSKEQAVSDAMIEAGLKAWDRMNAAMVARNASDNPEDMPDHDEGDIVRDIYLAMQAASHPLEQQQAVSGDVVERLDGCAKRARELGKNVAICLPSDVEQAVAALTASGVGRMRSAAQALIDDVRRRYPGEELRCPLMIELDTALQANDRG